MPARWVPGEPAWHELVRQTIDALPTVEDHMEDDTRPKPLAERCGAAAAGLVLTAACLPAVALSVGVSWRAFRWAAGL
jgi:hypothetical protein